MTWSITIVFQNTLAFLSMEDGRHARRAQSGTRRAGRPSSISIVDECGSDLAPVRRADYVSAYIHVLSSGPAGAQPGVWVCGLWKSGPIGLRSRSTPSGLQAQLRH